MNTNLEKQVAIRMKTSDYERLQKIAESKGLPVSALLRMWMFEKLREEEQVE